MYILLYKCKEVASFLYKHKILFTLAANWDGVWLWPKRILGQKKIPGFCLAPSGIASGGAKHLHSASSRHASCPSPSPLSLGGTIVWATREHAVHVQVKLQRRGRGTTRTLQ